MSDSPNFPLVDQLQAAGSRSAMAALLLRIPDNIILSHTLPLESACRALNFEEGAWFVLSRHAGLCATRDAHGLMPAQLGLRIDRLRRTLSYLAAGVVKA